MWFFFVTAVAAGLGITGNFIANHATSDRVRSRRQKLGIWIAVGVLWIATTITNVLLSDASSRPADVTASPKSSSGTGLGSPSKKVDNTQGWGPARRTFLMKKPAPYPVFNSITDNPVQGDERNFVQCKDKQAPNTEYRDALIPQDGHTYECFIFFDNDAAPNLDASVAGKLQNARIRVRYPPSAVYNPGVVGLLSADNTSTVWDSCNFVSPRRVKITYVRGSARLHTNGTPDVGAPLKETYRGGSATAGIVAGSGALLGDKQDGYLGQNAGFVLLDLTVTLEGE